MPTISVPPSEPVAAAIRWIERTTPTRLPISGAPQITVRVADLEAPVRARPGQRITAVWNVTSTPDGRATVTLAPGQARMRAAAEAILTALDWSPQRIARALR